MNANRRSFIAGSLAFGFSVASGQYARSASVNRFLRGDALKWNGVVIDLGPLKDFYRRRLGKGIWTGTKGLNKKGIALVQLLQDAGADGLEPSDYLSGVPKNVQELTGDDLAHVELILSQALWKFGRDLSAGRTTPSLTEPDIVISRKKTNISGWLKDAGRKGAAPVIEGLRPPHAQYLALRKLLASSKGRRARKIIVNMERWRWLPRGLGKRHVMVNQAAYEMMILESGKIVDKRPVVVGKPFHKTPMFSHRIKYAEFNPTWTVPRSIAGNEMLPKIRRDPGYLERNNYKVYTSWEADAPAMNPDSVDWNAVSAAKFPYRIEQQPGKKNALGKVKFLFPNRFNIYLHDTQAKNLFTRSQRAFSHGCIRVHKPLEFAERLFKGQRLDRRKIDKILSDPATHRVDLRRPVPIHLAYFTVWMEDGKPRFFDDVYGRDKMVAKILFGRA